MSVLFMDSLEEDHMRLLTIFCTILFCPSIAYGICGDGFIDEGEECDDLDLDDDDGCSSTCLLEEGWECISSSFTLDFYEQLHFLQKRRMFLDWHGSSQRSMIML